MTALVIVEARLKNPAKMAEYSAAAAPIVAAFGGEFIHRAKYVETLGGSPTPHGLGILRFSSADAARIWFNSPEYQAIVPLREEAAEMTFRLYEEA
ncbi:DUF1330 domain-containing protein [Bradyrhizobium sp. WD16]|uniref:DUF1330 domain-containing protein n=1 Tax=Bradyrhizobium sp. WD16 TaxID=1521768 RepID=UPI0020A30D3D|nr:DUF1330 domain-containing protein [Bradyrhizobium sp. WD16]UTD28882.1 DUF1330 domain-containing protein [Bradyrhizobium sp. WD16]